MSVSCKIESMATSVKICEKMDVGRASSHQQGTRELSLLPFSLMARQAKGNDGVDWTGVESPSYNRHSFTRSVKLDGRGFRGMKYYSIRRRRVLVSYTACSL